MTALVGPSAKLATWDLPQALNFARARRENWFQVHVPNDLAKLAFMRDQARELAVQPLLIELAVALARPYRSDQWMEQAACIHRFVRDGIRFRRHPGQRQQISDNALWRGYGACTEKVLAFCALCGSLGMDSDFWPIWRGTTRDAPLVHVRTAVRFPGHERFRTMTSNAPGAPAGRWIVSDPTIAGAELGQEPATMEKNPETGKLPLA